LFVEGRGSGGKNNDPNFFAHEFIVQVDAAKNIKVQNPAWATNTAPNPAHPDGWLG